MRILQVCLGDRDDLGDQTFAVLARLAPNAVGQMKRFTIGERFFQRSPKRDLIVRVATPDQCVKGQAFERSFRRQT